MAVSLVTSLLWVSTLGMTISQKLDWITAVLWWGASEPWEARMGLQSCLDEDPGGLPKEGTVWAESWRRRGSLFYGGRRNNLSKKRSTISLLYSQMLPAYPQSLPTKILSASSHAVLLKDFLGEPWAHLGDLASASYMCIYPILPKCGHPAFLSTCTTSASSGTPRS